MANGMETGRIVQLISNVFFENESRHEWSAWNSPKNLGSILQDQNYQAAARQTQRYTRRPDTERQPRIPLWPRRRRIRSLGPSTFSPVENS